MHGKCSVIVTVSEDMGSSLYHKTYWPGHTYLPLSNPKVRPDAS